MKPKELKGRKKAALLLILMGEERASKVYEHLDEATIEALTLEIASIRHIDPAEKLEVLKEAQEIIMAREFMNQGGVSYARELLERSMGEEKAETLLRKLTSNLQTRPFDFLRTSDPLQILSFLQGEHPQMIALILSFLAPEQSSSILGGLSYEMQAEVAIRIARMDRVTPEVLRDAESVLEKKFSTVIGQDFSITGGLDAVVEMINRAGRGTEKNILEILDEREPELAESIRKRLFVFEDIYGLDDRSLQRVLRDLDTKELSTALKGVSEELREKFFKNMSNRAAEMLREEMEYMGPVRLRDVEEAQQKVVNQVRLLEESGEIVLSRGEEEIVVS